MEKTLFTSVQIIVSIEYRFNLNNLTKYDIISAIFCGTSMHFPRTTDLSKFVSQVKRKNEL